jgi:hypothetical protein
MLKIHVEEDCGNAPKKIVLRDFNIAFAKNDRDFLLANITDNMRWTMVGDKVVEGKEQFTAALEQMAQRTASELTLANILTHGKVGAVDGTLTLKDGSRYGFCDVYQFSSNAKDAKIKALTSYVIQL